MFIPRPSWTINHSFISLYSKYQTKSFTTHLIVLAPVILSQEEVYGILFVSLVGIIQLGEKEISISRC